MMQWRIRMVWVVIGALLAVTAALGVAGQYRIEQQYPAIGDFVTVDGTRLHYVDQGPKDAQAILLVHGASSNLRDFTASLTPALQDRFRVIAFDRPGFGYSERYRGDWRNPAEIAAMLLDAASQLGVERPVVLGHSWAGSVVMSALVHHADRVAGGILLSGVAGHWVGSSGWTYDVAQIPVLGPLFAYTAVYPAGSLLLPATVENIVAPNPVPDGYIENLAAPLALRPRHFLYNVEDVTRLSAYMQQLSPRYRDIDHPLLVIHGTADDLVPYWNHGQRLESVVDGVQIALINGAGHAPHHTHTDQVSGQITTFLQELDRD